MAIQLLDDDEDNLICEINLIADSYRLCKAKAGHDCVLGKIDASLAKKAITSTEAPHLVTKALMTKLDVVAKTFDLGRTNERPNTWHRPIMAMQRNLQRMNHPKFNIRKDSSDVAKSWTDSCLKKRDNYYATMNLPTIWRTRSCEFAYHCHFS